MKYFKLTFIAAFILISSLQYTIAAEPEPERLTVFDKFDFSLGEHEASQILQVNCLLSYANKFYGVPYRYGATGPHRFDCSGFTSYVFREFGYSLSRTASAQFHNGSKVNRDSLRPGDLVFFGGRGNGKGIGHVGIVTAVDDNKHDFTFIHASCHRGITRSHSTESYYQKRYRTACRILK